jgi:urease accessory protein UreF
MFLMALLLLALEQKAMHVAWQSGKNLGQKKQSNAMLQPLKIAPATAAELAGDLAPLLEQLGSPAGLTALGGAETIWTAQPIRTVAGLRRFLRHYHEKVLQPVELPAIRQAFLHASRQESRELIALDHQLAVEPFLQPFSSPSRLIGRQQLERLRPLRDERVVQRYLAAIESGQAQGWHTLVFGLTLAIYSLPLRQGLHGYAQLAVHGFIQSASRSLGVSAEETGDLTVEFCAGIPSAVEGLLAQNTLVGA